MSITIRTNNVPRFTIDRWDLSLKEEAEFGYLPPEDGTFFRFKGNVYDLGEFSTTRNEAEYLDPAFKNWDGYQSDSFFHGILVKFVDGGGEKVVVGEYFC